MSVENRSYPGVHSADTAIDINPRRLFNVFRHGAQIEIFQCSLTILHAVWSDRYFLIDSDVILRYSGSIHCRVELALNTLIWHLELFSFLVLFHGIVAVSIPVSYLQDFDDV